MSDTMSTGSPPRPSNGRKERRNPSVTPRKFNRFFTPRSHGYQQTTASRHALNDITAPANNRGVAQSSPLRPKTPDSQENQNPMLFARDLKRRKLVHTPEGSPERSFLSKRKGVVAGNGGKARANSHNIQSSPCERVGRSTPYTGEVDELEELEEAEAGVYEDDEDEEQLLPPKPVKRIVPLSDRGLGGRLLQLSLGNSIRQHHEYPVNGAYSLVLDLKSRTHCCRLLMSRSAWHIEITAFSVHREGIYADPCARLARRDCLILQQTFGCPHMYQYRD